MTQEKAQPAQVGIIIVTHDDYGAALLRAAEHICGPVLDCAAITVDIGSDVSESVTRLKDAASRLDSGLGVLLLTDMFGGTPTNLSLALLGQEGARSEVLTGVNLPMLLKALGNRRQELSALAAQACAAGREGIAVAGEILRNRVKSAGQP